MITHYNPYYKSEELTSEFHRKGYKKQKNL